MESATSHRVSRTALLALAFIAAAAAAFAEGGVPPRYAGVEPNLGPAATSWSGTIFSVRGMTFAGFDAQEEQAIRRALETIPTSLSLLELFAEKGGADSYTPASYGGGVIIVGENQIFGDDGEGGTADDSLVAALVHELAHAWAQKNGPDQKRFLLWNFGNTVGESFVNTEDAFANEYARSCVEGARAKLEAGRLDPANIAGAFVLFEEDFANTVHEYFVFEQSGVAIRWMNIRKDALADPDAGQEKLAAMKELLDW